jgi:polysaccharide biosynthesis protein PslH
MQQNGNLTRERDAYPHTSLRILWVKAGKLLPVDTGGKIRSYNILRHLVRAHDVRLLTYYGGNKNPEYETEIINEFPGAIMVPTGALTGMEFAQPLDYFRRLFQAAPFAVSKFTHPEVRREVKQWMTPSSKETTFDVAVCDFLSASQNFPDQPPIPVVLFQHNVETALWQRLAAAETNAAKHAAYAIEACKMEKYERKALGRFHHVIAVSEHDRQQMLTMNPGCSITVVPTGVDTGKYYVGTPALVHPSKIVFLGSMDWEPNIDAVHYFCRDILPRIRARVPSAVLQIIGRNPHASVRQLACDSVEITGTVPSVIEYLHAATVVVVPLRIGGGTRLKIFEAMACGKAVVSTSIGAEGLAVENGRDLILADSADTFASAVISLLNDVALRGRYEQAAARLAAQYNWSKVAQQFAAALQSVCLKTVVSENP